MDSFVLKVTEFEDEDRVGKYLVHPHNGNFEGWHEFSPDIAKAKILNHDRAKEIQEFYHDYMDTEMKIIKVEVKEC